MSYILKWFAIEDCFDTMEIIQKHMTTWVPGFRIGQILAQEGHKSRLSGHSI